MPHLTLEYSDNIEFEVQPLLEQLHSELIATGAVNLKGIKSRAVVRHDYRLADGNPSYGFVHIDLLIREGRALEVQEEMAQRMLQVLEATFGHYFETGHISLSVNIDQMRDGVALTHHNIPPS